MSPENLNFGPKGTENLGANPGPGHPAPLTLSREDEESRKPYNRDMSSTTRNNQNVEAEPTLGFVDEIEALKLKILELERQANGGSTDHNLNEKEGHPTRHEQEVDQEKIEEILTYRRMQEFLYKHRKEWETKNDPGNWALFLGARHFYRDHKTGPRTWFFRDTDEVKNRYVRPDPFDPSFNLGDNEGMGDNAHEDNFFDDTISFGDRRERLRLNFEWELDRLYLAEEVHKRKKAMIEEEKLQRKPGRKAKSKVQHEGQETNTAESNLENDDSLSAFAEPKLNRLDWLSFTQRDEVPDDACVIDVLMGEPTIDDGLNNYRGWYGYSRHPVRNGGGLEGHRARTPTATENAPLPERVRIHSIILLGIMEKILGKSFGVTDGTPIVFLRPFKAFIYCEQALRAWCTALEKKFKTAPETGTDGLTVTKATIPNTSKDSHVSQQPAQTHDNNPASKLSTSSLVVETTGDQGDKQLQYSGTHGDIDGQVEKDEREEEDEDDPNDILKSLTALKHLKCLLSFMDSDISAKQTYLNDPNCRKVAFSDLWQLFRPGMEVIGSDGKQVYRVIQVNSAKHRVVPVWETWYNPSANTPDQTPFSITCVYIDFDGKHLGPVTKTLGFQRFEGERDITSLEVYPLRFHPLKQSDSSDSEWKRIENLPESHRLRQKLILRGKKFLETAAVKQMYYSGPTLVVRDEVESQVVVDFETAFSVEDEAQQGWKPELEMLIGNPSPQESEERRFGNCTGACCRDQVVYNDTYIDQKQKTEYIDSLLPQRSSLDDNRPSVAIIPNPLKELQTSSDTFTVSEDELIIMSYRVFGFVLRSRKWARLDLSYLTDTYPSETFPLTTRDDNKQSNQANRKKPLTAFDRLVLEDGHQSMIISLITQHFRDKNSKAGQGEQVDIVKGKGRGLILLLHGAPGVGKTSTAEGVAEMFQKPLFQITCGDLGTTANEVERALETNFALANKWGCILLLDEADVFLAERTKEDFVRNGLVAVFLRVMEYYSGVLFLTTNRVGDFDEAFTSRIHVALYYPELNSSKTVKVFKINLDMIEERFKRKGRRIDIETFEISLFAAKHFDDCPPARWNGRQIRNACQTALALAEFEAQGSSHEAIEKPDAVIKLTVEHFKVVQKAYLEFTNYIHDLYGVNAARRAKEGRLRAMWAEENDFIMAGIDKKKAFLAASQVRPQPGYQQQQPPPDQIFTQQQSFQQQPQQYYQYPNTVLLQPGYPNSAQAQIQQFPSGQPWNNAGMRAANTPTPMPGEGQNPVQQQAPPIPVTPEQQQLNTAWMNQNMQALYAASGQQGVGQASPSNVPTTGVSVAPGRPWSGQPGNY
ncbi:hypothetical protein F5884DRAFT_260292 [Xylogone sp. PMI_703]|nr:hypothetical protein F5884DRAFT_260292 [Xylogone sp. PMI_703]